MTPNRLEERYEERLAHHARIGAYEPWMLLREAAGLYGATLDITEVHYPEGSKTPYNFPDMLRRDPLMRGAFWAYLIERKLV